MKKVLSLILIILILSSLFLIYFERTSNASYNSKFANYPGYKELLDDLQKDHPNWEFEILETGLDWSDVLKAESVARHGRSLIQKCDGIWNCSTCNKKQYEPGWYCASSASVAYYLDPRNSLCDDYIFQFEQLTYDSKMQTREGVQKILADCKYLMKNNITYYDTKGKQQTINKTYVDVIMEAAKEYNVSPYHLASRIRQEQGVSGTSNIISGKWTGKDENGKSYKGYYNFFNWGAYGDNIVLNALKTAKKYGWTDPEKSIKGGAKLLAQNYISCGQDTLYLQKFDVVDGGDGYYGHQYMTNVSASKSEGLSVKNGYLKMGMLSKDSKMKFKIPVYKNMPTSQAATPGKETIVTQDVQINKDGAIVKASTANDAQTIATLNKGTKLLRIELTTKKDSSGNYLDKVVLADGRKGYIARSYLTKLSLQSNCNTKYVILNNIELRNGPGTENTDIIKYVSAGQMVTVVEKDKYTNLNGTSWYRVKLTDGDYGYISLGTTKNPNAVVYDETSTEYGYIKVICTDGLNIRTAPTTTSNNIISTVTNSTKLFRLQKDASNNEGYVWDKVVTNSGIVGYIVRQDKQSGQLWVKEYYSHYDVDDKKANITCIPDVTVEKLNSLGSNVVVKKGDKVIGAKDKIGTGYTITANGKKYTAVVKGDPSCDGVINSADLLKIVKHLKKTGEMKDNSMKSAADVNSDGSINSADLLKIVKYLKNTGSIEI